MISPAVLEQPGRWRVLGLAVGFAAVLSPAFPLLWEFVAASESAFGLGSDFGRALGRSMIIAAGAAACALALGFPSGLLAGLYRFPARRLLLAGLALPLIIPSFLWAIGLSMLRIELGLPRESLLSGAPGCILSFTALGTPLVVFAVVLAVRSLPRSNIDAARLEGSRSRPGGSGPGADSLAYRVASRCASSSGETPKPAIRPRSCGPWARRIRCREPMPLGESRGAARDRPSDCAPSGVGPRGACRICPRLRSR